MFNRIEAEVVESKPEALTVKFRGQELRLDPNHPDLPKACKYVALVRAHARHRLMNPESDDDDLEVSAALGEIGVVHDSLQKLMTRRSEILATTSAN